MGQPIGQSLVRLLRDAAWLTRGRVRAYLGLLLLETVCLVAFWGLSARNGLDLDGKPLGADFKSFWAAGRLALNGQPTLAYDPAVHFAAQRAAFGGAHIGYSAFFYPPLFLLVCLPLGWMAYLPALGVWLGLTGYACWRALRTLLGEAAIGLGALMLAFPGVFANLGHGQNAFLTTALFTLTILSLDRRPWLAGVFLGLMAFKPQLGLLAPLALIAAGRWKTVLAALGAVASFALATTIAFGPRIWPAFLAVTPLSRAALEQNLVGWQKMPSVFAAVALLHGSVALAYAVQAIAALFAGLVVVRVARTRRGREPGLAEGATLTTATLLATPFFLDYDLMILAIPLAWVVRQAHRTGFLPWEKTVLFAAFLLPLVTRAFAGATGLSVGPPVIVALLIIVARRAAGAVEDTAQAAPAA